MKELSIVAKTVQPSSIRKMFNLAADMKDVISFTVGEPDFDTPKHIVDAAIEALRRGETRYTPNAGILPLRKAISASFEKSHGIKYDPNSQLIVTSGGMEALLLTMLTILDPGDEIILPNPYWTNYPSQAQICSAVPRLVPVYEADGFMYRPEALEAAITPKTKAILINSPANPTGGVGSREALEAIAKIAVKHDLYVLSDEVYCNLLYDSTFTSIATLPGMEERTIIINSFSKTYAMTGWRVGFAAANADIIGNMVKLQEDVCACVNSAAQFGALAALEGTQEPLYKMQAEYAARRNLIVSHVNSIEGLSIVAPQGAFYAFINIEKTGLDSEAFAYGLLKSEGVIVVPGNAFGDMGDSFVRISYATSRENIEEGMKRIARYVAGLVG